MSTFQTQLLNEIAAGHDGPLIPESKRVYFQERYRERIFDFIITRFLAQKEKGLTKAKLARRIGRTPEVINRWLAGPTNLESDSISDLMLGIAAEEMEMSAHSVLNRAPVNVYQMPERRIESATTSSGSAMVAFLR
jgi:hypothetical protein